MNIVTKKKNHFCGQGQYSIRRFTSGYICVTSLLITFGLGWVLINIFRIHAQCMCQINAVLHESSAMNAQAT